MADKKNSKTSVPMEISSFNLMVEVKEDIRKKNDKHTVTWDEVVGELYSLFQKTKKGKRGKK